MPPQAPDIKGPFPHLSTRAMQVQTLHSLQEESPDRKVWSGPERLLRSRELLTTGASTVQRLAPKQKPGSTYSQLDCFPVSHLRDCYSTAGWHRPPSQRHVQAAHCPLRSFALYCFEWLVSIPFYVVHLKPESLAERRPSRKLSG